MYSSPARNPNVSGTVLIGKQVRRGAPDFEIGDHRLILAGDAFAYPVSPGDCSLRSARLTSSRFLHLWLSPSP
jgi:hypothetical protein